MLTLERHGRRRNRTLPRWRVLLAILVGATCLASLVLAPSARAASSLPVSPDDQVLPDATAGQPYSAQIQITWGTAPYTVAVADGTVPPGLSVSPSGLVSGIPQAPQVDAQVTSTFRIATTDSGGYQRTVYVGVEITVSPADYQGPPPLQITTTQVPDPQVGQAYSFTMQASGGTSPYTWSAQGFPAGFSMDSSGTITGSSGQEEQGTVTVVVIDAAREYLGNNQWIAGQGREATFTFTVSSGIPVLDPALVVAWAAVDAAPNAPSIVESELNGILGQIPGGGTTGGTLGYVEGEVCQLTYGVVNKSCVP